MRLAERRWVLANVCAERGTFLWFLLLSREKKEEEEEWDDDEEKEDEDAAVEN